MSKRNEVDEAAPRRSLAHYAQVAEIVASLAVLVTLVFLLVEVRSNTEVARTSFYDQALGELNEWRIALAADPELTRLYFADVAGAPESPGTADRRIQLMLNVLWAIYEKSYYANSRGLLGESEWSRFETQICAAYGRAGDRWSRPIGIRSLLTAEFAEFSESTCAR